MVQLVCNAYLLSGWYKRHVWQTWYVRYIRLYGYGIVKENASLGIFEIYGKQTICEMSGIFMVEHS
jgi:hypothetical protein